MKKRKISLAEYAAKYNPQRTRRNHKMSESYLYRLIRQDIKGTGTRSLWFKYVLEGEKDRIWIIC
jgi:hypothetical protein